MNAYIYHIQHKNEVLMFRVRYREYKGDDMNVFCYMDI